MFQCPKCQKDSGLKISCYVHTMAYIESDGTVTDSDTCGGMEWDDTNQAECTECEWIGTVEDMTVEEDEL